MKTRTLKPRPHGRSLFFLNFVLLLIPLVYFGYQSVLRASTGILISEDMPEKSDAVAVLGGGEPGRAWEAADLYNQNLARYVIVTRETPRPEVEDLRHRGVDLVDGRGNYIRVLRGLGVPEGRIITVGHPVDNSLDEIVRLRDLCNQKKWKSLIIVTSNYHTRRARLIARYALYPSVDFSVVGATHGGLEPEWWKNQDGLRTFLIEFEKLIVYTIYLGPRVIL